MPPGAASGSTSTAASAYSARDRRCARVIERALSRMHCPVGALTGARASHAAQGVLLSCMEREGLFTRKWDFAVAGVTTISLDLHK